MLLIDILGNLRSSHRLIAQPTTIHYSDVIGASWHIKLPATQPFLTHWDRDKMVAILQTTFTDAFSWMKMYRFRLKFQWYCSQGSSLQCLSISSDIGLVPTRRQAIVWTIDGLVYWRIYASFGLNQGRPNWPLWESPPLTNGFPSQRATREAYTYHDVIMLNS